MENKSHVLSGLLKKQSEIAGQIECAHRALNGLVADLDHIDHAIRIVDPNCGLPRVDSKLHLRRKGFFRGEMARFVLGHLRTATEPCTSLEIALAVMDGRGLDIEDRLLVSVMKDRVAACLWRQKQKGVFREVAYTGE
jgi:hypothetical protein